MQKRIYQSDLATHGSYVDGVYRQRQWRAERDEKTHHWLGFIEYRPGDCVDGVPVHGGVSHLDSHYLGFDTAHLDIDYIPRFFKPSGTYRTLEYVEGQCKRGIDHLLKQPDP